MANTSIKVDTVGLGISWSLGETYRVQMDEGFLRQSDGLQLPIAGNTSIMTFSTPADRPKIANTIPTHTSTAPINITDISFTIDRSVGNLTILGGNVYLNRQGSPNVVVKTFAVSNASISGNTVAFSIIGNLEASQTYFITSNANIFVDRDGFKNNAISTSSSFRFISPTAPTVTAFTPGNATVASRNFTNVAIDFDRTIFSNSGNLFLHNANTSAVIRTYPISSGLISNNKITLDVVGNINANGYYYISSNANVIMDVTQIKYPGLTNASTFTFKAPTNPYLESTVPTNATTSASRSLTTASFTLDRTVTALSGNVYLYEQSSPNVLLKTWTIGSNVTFNSDRTFSVTVPQGMLAPTQAYYVTTDANIAKDLTYINFPGISTTGNVFRFTTDVAPLISTFSPTYMEAIDETNNTISFTMDRLVNKNVGNIYLYKNDIVNGNALVKTYNINSNLTLTDNLTISANVANTLLVMEKYYVTSDYDILSDYYTGEKFRGIINANTFVFTTAVDREYYGNEFRKLFPTNVPQITDANSASTYSITITMADAIGHIQQLSEEFASPAGWNAGTKTYTITGTKTSCNAILANLYYFPNKTVTSNSTLTYSQTKDSVLQKTLSFTLFGRSSVVDFLTGDNNTYAIPEDSKYNFMPFYMYPQWDANVAVMFKSVDAYGNVVTSAGTFNANTAAGWTTPYDGVIHKTFSRPANISVYNSQLAEIRDIYYWLASDYTSNVKIDALVGIESTVSGNTLSGGTVYSGSNNYTITPSGEYTLLTSSTYTEDAAKAISLTIDNADVHPNITYNVQMQQISPDPGLITGAFTSPGVGTRSWGSINDTQAKSAWDAVYFYPPQDYTGEILIGATITKIETGKANVTLASNVAITLTNAGTHNEYEFQENRYYNDLLNGFGLQITDQGNQVFDTYYLSIYQISPDPAVYPANIIIQGTDYGVIANVSGSRSAINGWLDQWYSYPDYVGDYVFGYSQIKSSYNGNVTQASNVAVTYTNYPYANNYSITGGTYIEDTDKTIDLSITDADTRFNNYYINLRQISPDPSSNVGNIILGSTYGTNVSVYANRATINSLTKTISPPADWTSNIVLGYTQIKSTAFGNITQADNVAITYTNINSHNEVYVPTFSNIGYSNIAITLGNSQQTLSNFYSNIQLALLGNGANSSSSILDTSQNNYTFTNSGPVRYSDAVAKWGNGTSLYFNGSSRLSINATTNLLMPADFTWEFWVYPTTGPAKPIISHNAYGRFMMFTNGYWEMNGVNGSGGLLSGTIGAATIDAWTHYAITRQGNRLRVFGGGVMQANVAIFDSPETTNSLNIGYYPNGNEYFTGYMQDIAYYKGWAKYTANFTPQALGDYARAIRITDLAQNKSYTATFTILDNLGNISSNNTATISGNINAVNTALANNITFYPGYYGNIRTLTVNYLQTQTTDNIIQANVDIPFTIYPIPATPTAVVASVYSNVTYNNVSASISYTPSSNSDSVSYYEATLYGTNTKGTANSGNIIISGLTVGTAYRFSVKAIGAYGNSSQSALSDPLTIYSPPSAPTIGTATAISNTSARISYTAPSGYKSDGGYGITRFTAVSNPGNITGYVNQSISGTITVNGLSPSTDYTFNVYASHIYGNSVLSSASNTITTPANNLPSSPQNAIASSAGDSSINITWQMPSYTGNTNITGYTITSNVGNVTTIGNITSASIGYLSNTQPYTFDIYATNSYGNGAVVTTNAALVGNSTTQGSAYFSNVSASTLYIRGTGSSEILTGDFTLEAWIYNTNTVSTAERGLFDLRRFGGITNYDDGIAIRQDTNSRYLVIASKSDTLFTANGRINNQWQHLALVRSGTDVTLYLDGQAANSGTHSRPIYSTANIRLSGFNDDTSSNATFQGWMDNFRLSNVARYTTNFTPSTSSPTIDNNTLCVLRFNNFPFTDASYYSQSIISSGVTISTTNYI